MRYHRNVSFNEVVVPDDTAAGVVGLSQVTRGRSPFRGEKSGLGEEIADILLSCLIVGNLQKSSVLPAVAVLTCLFEEPYTVLLWTSLTESSLLVESFSEMIESHFWTTLLPTSSMTTQTSALRSDTATIMDYNQTAQERVERRKIYRGPRRECPVCIWSRNVPPGAE